MTDLRYPIGEFTAPDEITPEMIAGWIDEIERLPGDLRAAVAGLSDEQLDTPYRPDGWTVRQVVHHVGDSHLNSLIRFKWTLTEDRPKIKAYFEDRWAELADYRDVPIELSLTFLESLHGRWVILLRSMNEKDFRREFVHPDFGVVRLDGAVGTYAWHGKHHVAHITELAKRQGWS